MTNELHQTPLHCWHAEHKGRLVDFAGWSMPVQYGSIVDEHVATRTAVGLFDISHMGRFFFDGPDAESFLERLLTRRVTGLKLGTIRYSLLTNDQGGILDDVLIYHLERPAGGTFYLLVVNAGNREKIAAWIDRHVGDADVGFQDRTFETAMIAVQGPRSAEVVCSSLNLRLDSLGYYTGRPVEVGGQSGYLSRTGYTGEDGCELIVPAASAVDVWQRLLDGAAGQGGSAVGLGARDTLRLEAAMPLYGHELSEDVDPYQAGLGFAVQLENRQFPGRDALAERRERGSTKTRVGLEMEGRRVPRENYVVSHAGRACGEVTSGTFSPTLQRPIAMAYIDAEFAAVGTEVCVDLRGKELPARVVGLPFYTRPE